MSLQAKAANPISGIIKIEISADEGGDQRFAEAEQGGSEHDAGCTP